MLHRGGCSPVTLVVALLAGACGAAGCGGSTAPAGANPTPAAMPTGPAPQAATPATPAPTASATAPTATAATADADAEPVRPPAVTGVFRTLARGRAPMASFLGWHNGHPVLTLMGWGPKLMSGANEAGHYKVDERLWQGVDTTVLVDAVGDFAGDAFLMGFSDTGRAVGEGEIFARKTGGRWRPIRRLKRLSYYAGMSRWSQGRVLALIHERGFFIPNPKPPRFVVVHGGRGGADLPQLTLTEKFNEFSQKKYRDAVVEPTRMVAFESGHVYAIGEDKAEWWAPGKRKGSIVEGLSVRYDAVIAKHGDGELYIGDSAITKIADGQVETIDLPVTPRVKRELTGMAVTDDGTIWLALDGEVHRRPVGKDWQRIAFTTADGAVKAKDVAARGDRVWVTGQQQVEGQPREVVIAWSGPKPDQVAQIDFGDDVWSGTQYATKDLERPKPAQPGCESVFALFYGVTKYAAPGYDFPKTREALKGHREFSSARFVKTKVRDQEYFGAFAKDLRQGEELVKIIAAEVPGATPQLLCHRPPVVAELDFDLATGKSRGWKEAAQ